MKSKHLILTLVLIISFNACREIYEPNIDTDKKGLVVNGLISDADKTYNVRLSWANPFNKGKDIEPVLGANVSIADNCSNTFPLNEGLNGVYYTDSISFTPQVGNIYKLHITLENGDTYESDEQILLSSNPIANIYGAVVEKDFRVGGESSSLVQTLEGIETYLDFNFSGQNLPRFRIDVSLIIEYSYDVGGGGMSQNTNFCWKRVTPNKNINISTSKYDLESTTIKKHVLCFIPKDKDYWDLDGDYSCFILRIQGYWLNEKSYDFYKKAFDQLEADNSLFDPIAVQLPSNIRCTSDPDKIVLGFFEASSVIESTHLIFERSSTDIRYINSPSFPKNISIRGCLLNQTPSFWFTNYLTK